jgi:uncharacterized protein (TIGR02996 family)
MVSESAFIDALRETPDDLALRLVYADWLDDAGDSRGELVRLQCELDRTPLGQPRRNVLCQAIRDLCRDCQSDWLAPLKRRVLGWQKARFQFGLVENVVMSPTAFLKHAEAGLFVSSRKCPISSACVWKDPRSQWTKPWLRLTSRNFSL